MHQIYDHFENLRSNKLLLHRSNFHILFAQHKNIVVLHGGYEKKENILGIRSFYCRWVAKVISMATFQILSFFLKRYFL